MTGPFVEAGPDGPDATVVMVQARAEPVGDGAPSRGGLMWDGTARDEPPRWSTMLHGDGWTASWQAPRPVVGEVVLSGTVVADLGGGQVRGRVTRARVVSETFDLTDPDHPRIPALQRLREVDRGPRWFDHGLVPPPDAPRTGWCTPVPGDPYVRETGVLVDLDLDDVPPLPPRPSIVPGALSAHGRDLWVADTRLPSAIRLRDGGITRFDRPGRILSTQDSRGRGVHADAGGCWITGPDGVHRWAGAGVRAVLEVRVPIWASRPDGHCPEGPAGLDGRRPDPGPDPRPRAGGWPLTGQAGPRPDGPCWLLAELDPVDLAPLRSAYVPAVPTTVSADGEWLLAAGVRRWDRADWNWWTSPT